VYKPSPVIYGGLVSYLNSKNEGKVILSSNVWLVSGNPFDVSGSRAAGLNAIWIDKSGSGWVDQISPEGQNLTPTHIVNTLEDIPPFIKALTNDLV